jgi:hypothetical protein
MTDTNGQEIDSVPIVMLDSRELESPAGSGKFVRVGSELINSELATATTPNTAEYRGRLIDTSADASHVIEGNHLTLGQLQVRLQNAWASSRLRANIATSTRPLGSHQFFAPAGILRGGNLLMASDGMETDSFMAPGTVSALPTAGPEYRGRMIRVEGGATSADRLYICEKDAGGKYAWRGL